jgi:hypothetical protein
MARDELHIDQAQRALALYGQQANTISANFSVA